MKHTWNKGRIVLIPVLVTAASLLLAAPAFASEPVTGDTVTITEDMDDDPAKLAALAKALKMSLTELKSKVSDKEKNFVWLKRLAGEDWVRARVRSLRAVARLWAACGLPDFRKLGADPHARFIARVFKHLSEGSGHIPHQWFAD